MTSYISNIRGGEYQASIAKKFFGIFGCNLPALFLFQFTYTRLHYIRMYPGPAKTALFLWLISKLGTF